MSKDKSIFKQAAEAGAQKILDYFNATPESQESKFNAAMLGVKAGRNFASLYSAETNRLATQVNAAKAIGLRGDALIPVFEEISGMDARQFLPKPGSERSSAGHKPSKRSRDRNHAVS